MSEIGLAEALSFLAKAKKLKAAARSLTVSSNPEMIISMLNDFGAKINDDVVELVQGAIVKTALSPNQTISDYLASGGLGRLLAGVTSDEAQASQPALLGPTSYRCNHCGAENSAGGHPVQPGVSYRCNSCGRFNFS